MHLVASALLLAVVYQGGQGYSTGPPPSACLTLYPLHGVNKQSGQPPFRLVMSSATYRPGQKLSLRVESTHKHNRTFKGFQVTAHRVRTSGNHEEFMGHFTAANNSSQTVDCLMTRKSMITHADPSNKTSVSFHWTAPSANMGDLHFFLTVLENKETFWTRIPYPLQAESPEGVVPQETTVPSVLVSSAQPPDWSTCYRDKGCWMVPERRRGGCDMQRGECLAALSYRQQNGKFIFELSYKNEGQYFALGFSNDQFMGHDLAIVCTGLAGHESIHMGFNHGVPGPYKYYFRQYTRGLSDLEMGQANGHTYCKFTTAATMTVLNMNVTRTYDLRERHYLFLSWGRIFDGTDDIYGHTGAPAVSESEVYLTDYNAFSSGADSIITSSFMLASVILALLLHL